MNSFAIHNRNRAALAAGALAREGNAVYSREGKTPGMSAAFLDAMPEADVERGLDLLRQRGGIGVARKPGAKAIVFGKVIDGLPAWLTKARTPSPIELRAMRDMRIANAITAGEPISAAIESVLNDEALRAQVRQAESGREDDDTRREYEQYDRSRQIKQQIAEHTKWLADSRAGKHTYAGPNITAAMGGGNGTRDTDNPKRWKIALHESGHAIACLDIGGKVDYATVFIAGGGECQCSTSPPLDAAIITAAAAHAEWHFFQPGAGPMQDLGAGTDRPRFLAELAAHYGKPVGEFDDEAIEASRRAGAAIEFNEAAVLGLARVLYDNVGERVPGETCRMIFDFHKGKYADIVEAHEQARYEASLRLG